MARRDPVEYGTLLAKALGRELDADSLKELALIPPFHADIKAFITSLPAAPKEPKKSVPKAVTPKKKGAKSSGKEE